MSCLGPDILPDLADVAPARWVVADRHHEDCDNDPCWCQHREDGLVDNNGVRFYLHPADPAEQGAFAPGSAATTEWPQVHRAVTALAARGITVAVKPGPHGHVEVVVVSAPKPLTTYAAHVAVVRELHRWQVYLYYIRGLDPAA